MKKTYVAPSVETVKFDTEEILLTSIVGVKPLEWVGGQHASELGTIDYFLD